MCKYCDNIFDENIPVAELYFKRSGPDYFDRIDKWKNKNKKILGVIVKVSSNCKNLEKEAILSIKGKSKKNYLDWLDLKINYCPICGKQLRKKLIDEENINGTERNINW